MQIRKSSREFKYLTSWEDFELIAYKKYQFKSVSDNVKNIVNSEIEKRKIKTADFKGFLRKKSKWSGTKCRRCGSTKLHIITAEYKSRFFALDYIYFNRPAEKTAKKICGVCGKDQNFRIWPILILILLLAIIYNFQAGSLAITAIWFLLLLIVYLIVIKLHDI